jgi:hypothetical protein
MTRTDSVRRARVSWVSHSHLPGLACLLVVAPYRPSRFRQRRRRRRVRNSSQPLPDRRQRWSMVCRSFQRQSNSKASVRGLPVISRGRCHARDCCPIRYLCRRRRLRPFVQATTELSVKAPADPLASKSTGTSLSSANPTSRYLLATSACPMSRTTER